MSNKEETTVHLTNNDGHIEGTIYIPHKINEWYNHHVAATLFVDGTRKELGLTRGTLIQIGQAIIEAVDTGQLQRDRGGETRSYTGIIDYLKFKGLDRFNIVIDFADSHDEYFDVRKLHYSSPVNDNVDGIFRHVAKELIRLAKEDKLTIFYK